MTIPAAWVEGVAVETLELLGDVEKPADGGLLVGLLLETRLLLDRLVQGRRVGRIVGHQLADPVDQPVGHFQNTADIAQSRARLQASEGDDLRHLLAAIFGDHIADHLIAPVLAEIDVEVGHRHTGRVEESVRTATRSAVDRHR